MQIFHDKAEFVWGDKVIRLRNTDIVTLRADGGSIG